MDFLPVTILGLDLGFACWWASIKLKGLVTGHSASSVPQCISSAIALVHSSWRVTILLV